MKTLTGLDILLRNFPPSLKGKKIGVLCHAPSVTSRLTHIIDELVAAGECEIAAVFGPQHGLFGQTQDNMIEWEGYPHPTYGMPVYSLYGEVRTPTPAMLRGIDTLVVDLQDVGARPYTYVWTLKNCMEICEARGIDVLVLDRPNPIGAVPFDGPMLKPQYFSFVGGAPIPLSHRMTLGEMALFLKETFFQKLRLDVVWMENWWRTSMWSQTGLPWVLPSPNMPAVETAVVYPGMVLLEATNMSEGRGTTRPFELVGAPYLDSVRIIHYLRKQPIKGCIFREHSFIPTFQKWKGEWCNGLQFHVAAPQDYEPVLVTVALLSAVLETSGDKFEFKNPPYEYEKEKMPFDILAGDSSLRSAIKERIDVSDLRDRWSSERQEFFSIFRELSHYPEELS